MLQFNDAIVIMDGRSAASNRSYAWSVATINTGTSCSPNRNGQVEFLLIAIALYFAAPAVVGLFQYVSNQLSEMNNNQQAGFVSLQTKWDCGSKRSTINTHLMSNLLR